VLHVFQGDESFTRHFGKAASDDAMFLLGSISKPINVTAVMTLFDQGKFQLDDRVKDVLPEFTGGGRDDVTIRHLLTHTAGLPDQLTSNNELRKQHAPLSTFVEQALRAPLSFAAGSRYQYSSMGILLATRIAEILSGADILTLVDRRVFQPLGMKHSAQGLGRFKLAEMMMCQMDGAAPESGAGDPQAKTWNWNSAYWRALGAPWGGTHASAPDIGNFLLEFMRPSDKLVRPETARLMITNHNPPGVTPRGLGFAVGPEAGSPGCSQKTFGHYRFDRHALLGRPRERYDLHRADIAAEPRGPTASARGCGAARRGRSSPLSLRITLTADHAAQSDGVVAQGRLGGPPIGAGQLLGAVFPASAAQHAPRVLARRPG
jgi:CubicO group peptidase (beta-lactamase class C family)